MFNNSIVLVIDDDTWMQRVLSKIINKLDITEIYSASNGFDGVNLAIEIKPDVIFLDLLMPEINGLATLKMLKTIKLTKDIPVVIITSNSDFESLGAVLASGASEFVAKPFTFTTIQDKLVKVLENNKEKNDDNEPEHVFDNLGLETDDVEFLNSFIIDTSLDKNSTDKTEQLSKANHKNISQTYTKSPEDEIKKLLDN